MIGIKEGGGQRFKEKPSQLSRKLCVLLPVSSRFADVPNGRSKQKG